MIYPFQNRRRLWGPGRGELFLKGGLGRAGEGGENKRKVENKHKSNAVTTNKKEKIAAKKF